MSSIAFLTVVCNTFVSFLVDARIVWHHRITSVLIHRFHAQVLIHLA